MNNLINLIDKFIEQKKEFIDLCKKNKERLQKQKKGYDLIEIEIEQALMLVGKAIKHKEEIKKLDIRKAKKAYTKCIEENRTMIYSVKEELSVG